MAVEAWSCKSGVSSRVWSESVRGWEWALGAARERVEGLRGRVRGLGMVVGDDEERERTEERNLLGLGDEERGGGGHRKWR